MPPIILQLFYLCAGIFILLAQIKASCLCRKLIYLFGSLSLCLAILLSNNFPASCFITSRIILSIFIFITTIGIRRKKLSVPVHVFGNMRKKSTKDSCFNYQRQEFFIAFLGEIIQFSIKPYIPLMKKGFYY